MSGHCEELVTCSMTAYFSACLGTGLSQRLRALALEDPRVLYRLVTTLTEAQRTEFFADIHEWYFSHKGQQMHIGRRMLELTVEQLKRLDICDRHDRRFGRRCSI